MSAKAKTPSDRENRNDSRKFAQESLLSRIKLREYVLTSFVLASLPLFAVAVHSNKHDILFALPYMSVAFALQVLRYEFSITRLSLYLVTEYEGEQFDNSWIFHELTGRFLWARFVSHLILLELPPLMSLIYNSKHALESPFPKGTLWWFGLVCMLISFFALLIAHIDRWRFYTRKEWPWRKPNNRG